jgi:hypothetical protein
LTDDDGAMLWQAEAGFSFRLSRIYAMVPQRDGRPDAESPLLHPYVVQEYLATEEVGSISDYPRVPADHNVAPQIKIYVARQHVGAILISRSAPNATAVARTLNAALGPPKLTDRNFELWVIT